jgi:hypothetical protein
LEWYALILRQLKRTQQSSVLEATENNPHLLKKADLVLLLLAKIASSANVLARNRTINCEHITSDEQQSLDVYKILGESSTHVKVVKRGKKETVQVGCPFLSMD